MVIPRTLTINAAHDATDLVAKLRAHHYAAQTPVGPLASAQGKLDSAADLSSAAGTEGVGGAGGGVGAGAVKEEASIVKTGKERLKYTGLDLTVGAVRDNLAAGVVEPAISKIKSLRFATEAAISILRIDDMIKLNPAREEKHRR